MKNNKYNKKLKYRKHPYLIDIMNFKSFLTTMGMTTIFIILLMLVGLGGYSNVLKSMGFTSTVTLFLYSLILRPNIYNGKIKAYYRRNYDIVSKLNSIFLFLIGFLASKFIVVSVYQMVELKDIYYPVKNIIHPIGTTTVISLFVLMLYFTFYNDKYATIREFSDKVNYEMMFNGRNVRDALRCFQEEKDKEYDIKEFDGTYYDYREVEKEKKSDIRETSGTIRREMREENDRNYLDEKNKRRL